MHPTPPPGPDAPGQSLPSTLLPSTLGGPGWEPRAATHAAEIGTVWAPYAVRSHVAPLTDVLLALPGPEQEYPEDPGAWLMLDRPDLPRLRAQTESLATFYRSQGVTPHLFRPAAPKPNHLFQCDLFFMTPEGAILARMAARQRAGEERGTAEALASLGVPILLTPRGEALFEGADAMWLDERTVLVGVGKRTNHAAVRQIAPVLADMGVRVVPVEVGAGVQHLLGVVNLITPTLAAVIQPHMTPSLRDALGAADIELIELPSDNETEDLRAMNFVTLAPGRIVMPDRCPRTMARYEAHGVECHPIDVSEYIKAAGALGCLTGILSRA
ncbi:MAG: arginine deiminase family protein [Pseudomonadota bacterium]|nr:arginine deiminase family protein [Pseudomonadota bacterium]